jgi:4-amino-4-deoxy-L-arabinose transferase-like glycosyltransferase
VTTRGGLGRALAAHTLVVFAVALGVRLALVWWAHARFPPIADGEFYHRFATRLALGLGYTVAWPDGAVTYAAHYPVGYPAILSVAYRVLGSTAGVAMGVNAVIGAVASACAHRIALREMVPMRALAAGLALAIHPSLVLYTPAVMTEGVASALVVIAIACAPTSERPVWTLVRLVGMGVAFGVATLVRPQIIVLAPLLAFVFVRPRRVRAAAVVLGVALVTVAPWTLRNCVRMDRCAPVSVNGGWNLLIGTQTTTGGWTELETPEGCTTVWDEAAKDACFERAARHGITSAPLAWLSKAPRKLAATFDVVVAGPWYLYRSNAHAFGERAVIVSGAIETIAVRALLVFALVSSAPLWRVHLSLRRREACVHQRRRLAWTVPRLGLAALAIVFALSRTAWPAYAVLSILCLVRERDERRSPIRTAAGVVIGVTMVTHATFFGAGRYALLVMPLVTLAAFACVRPKALSASA